MEVDPPKDEASVAEAGAPAAEGGEKEPSKNEDAEMKEDDSKADSKAAEDPAKKEYRTEKRKKVISKTIDLPVTSIVVGAMSRDKLDAAVEQEKVLVNQDTYEGNRYVHLYQSTINPKTHGGGADSIHRVRIWLVFLQFSSKLLKKNFW